MENQTHWKKAFKSDYLSSSDIESGDLKATIKDVKYQECITASGKKFCNVAHFSDSKIKPMILNVTNSKVVKAFTGGKRFIEEWKKIPVQIYVDANVRFGNETTEGLRIRKTQPVMTKPELAPSNKEVWTNAIAYLSKDGTIDGIKQKYTLSAANEKLLKDAVI